MDLWSSFPPRPQFKRSVYKILNNNWTLNGRDVGPAWSEKTSEESLVYICDFVLDGTLRNDAVRTVLHLGAVDQICDVTVNGTPLAHHEGGYLPFDVDLTDVAIVGLNRLRVDVTDALDLSFPYGKQCKEPHGMWYTPVSGIWQPVWIEAVPRTNAIRGLKITSDLKGIDLLVDTDAPSFTVSVAANPAIRVKSTKKTVRITVPSPRHWTPEDPFLYPFTVETETDRVESYFALRTVTLEEAGGH
ncbi:MAG: glycoside hydrolase family 2, partial [Firmicutes bacterium]|nr:glycoside hydrolase family 2 [Bacillota bacterium]